MLLALSGRGCLGLMWPRGLGLGCVPTGEWVATSLDTTAAAVAWCAAATMDRSPPPLRPRSTPVSYLAPPPHKQPRNPNQHSPPAVRPPPPRARKLLALVKR